MSTENLTTFTEAVAVNPDLAATVQAIHADAAREVAKRLAALSAEAGAPFTADEFLADTSRQAVQLSDEQLEAVAGGVWNANPGNITASILSFGLVCAMLGVASAALTNTDDCQLSKDKGL